MTPRSNRLVALLGALVVVLSMAACVGDEPARAEVNGISYAIGPVRGLRVREDILVPWGTVERTNADGFFLDFEAFTIGDVDPEALLLVRAAPGLQNDPDDPWGPYVGLWGPVEDQDLCSYIDASAVSYCE